MKILKNAFIGLAVTATFLAVMFLSVTIGQLVGDYYGIEPVLSGLVGLALTVGTLIGALKAWIDK